LSAAEADRLTHLIEAAGLPTQMPRTWRGTEFEQALKLDKKRAGDGLEFVLIDRLGHALTRTLTFAEVVSGIG
jgi:3-dehydroquinate synthetase